MNTNTFWKTRASLFVFGFIGLTAYALSPSDTDQDGIYDSIEIRAKLDRKNPKDAAEDRDNDGFSNFDELITFEGKKGCIDDDKDHPPFILLYTAVKAPIKPLPFMVRKIIVNGQKNTWQVQLNIVINNRVKKITRNIVDAEAIDVDKLLNFTLKNIDVDETDPLNTSKMKLTFENAAKEQVVTAVGQEIAPPKSFRIDFTKGKDNFPITQIGEKFKVKGPNNEVQNYILRGWDAQKLVAKVFCEETKTESEIGARSEVKLPVKKE